MKLEKKLKINGFIYKDDDLIDFCNNKIKSSNNNLEKEIYEFILKWFDSEDYISVQTSGTTNKPKIIKLSKQHMVNSAINTINYFNIQKHHNILLCLPARFISGKMMIVRAYVSQCNLKIVIPSRNPFEKLTDERIYLAALTPYQLENSLDSITKLKIENIIIGGAEIPYQLEEKIKSILHINFYATYGMTETCSHVAIRKIDNKSNMPIYKALPNISFSIDDRNCLIIEAPLISNDKITTNDIVELIDNKSFIWKGRYDNVINSGGIKFYPEEIEKKISRVIKYPFFIGSLKDDKLGEKVVLFIEKVDKQKIEIEILKNQLKSILSEYENPKEIIVLEKFIYSENNKLQRKQTISEYLKNFL